MGRKASSNSTNAEEDTKTVVTTKSSTDAPVKVNNASASELKNACDDTLKKILSGASPGQFNQHYLHTDVRLALGYSNVIIALGASYYGYKNDFEKAKPVVWAGVILYVLLSAVQTFYAYFIEGDTVFVGKRRSFAKVVESERITITSRTIPVSNTARANTSSLSNAPSYSLSLNYIRTSGGGKTLIRREKLENQERSYGAFFTEDGTLDEEKFAGWVWELVRKVVGEDEDDSKVQ